MEVAAPMPEQQHCSKGFKTERLTAELLRIAPHQAPSFTRELIEVSWVSAILSLLLTLFVYLIRGIYLLVSHDLIIAPGGLEAFIFIISFLSMLILLMSLTMSGVKQERQEHNSRIEEISRLALAGSLKARTENGIVIFFKTDEVAIGAGRIEQSVELLHTSFADAQRIGETIEACSRPFREDNPLRPLFTPEVIEEHS